MLPHETSPQLLALIERLNRIVRDRGDVELFIGLDRIMDRETDDERTAALALIVKTLSENNRRSQLKDPAS